MKVATKDFLETIRLIPLTWNLSKHVTFQICQHFRYLSNFGLYLSQTRKKIKVESFRDKESGLYVLHMIL